MQIIPVMDIMNGVVVRGIGGRREEYRPIVSQLTSSCKPLDVARVFRDHLGLSEIYLADLDAISGAEPAWNIYEEIRSSQCTLWVDAGVRDVCRAMALVEKGINSVIVGLETLAGPKSGEAICQKLDPVQIIFSLDLKEGRPIGDLKGWNRPDAYFIAVQTIGFGVRRLIVLDLARVGLGTGLGTEDLCRRLAKEHPEVEITAGGGIRGAEDLRRLAECGVHSVLVASALHDGRLRPEDWRELHQV
jgi:phosphoribosylformimino-5-aminoimidazole carboxamide ribotide isomerase